MPALRYLGSFGNTVGVVIRLDHGLESPNTISRSRCNDRHEWDVISSLALHLRAIGYSINTTPVSNVFFYCRSTQIIKYNNWRVKITKSKNCKLLLPRPSCCLNCHSPWLSNPSKLFALLLIFVLMLWWSYSIRPTLLASQPDETPQHYHKKVSTTAIQSTMLLNFPPEMLKMIVDQVYFSNSEYPDVDMSSLRLVSKDFLSLASYHQFRSVSIDCTSQNSKLHFDIYTLVSEGRATFSKFVQVININYIGPNDCKEKRRLLKLV